MLVWRVTDSIPFLSYLKDLYGIMEHNVWLKVLKSSDICVFVEGDSAADRRSGKGDGWRTVVLRPLSASRPFLESLKSLGSYF